MNLGNCFWKWKNFLKKDCRYKQHYQHSEIEMTIIKEDIIHDVVTKLKINRNIAKNLVESILKHIKYTLASGNGILISGFGDFKVVHKKARIGRNPKTKEEHIISERKVVVFSPSKVFRKEMNP